MSNAHRRAALRLRALAAAALFALIPAVAVPHPGHPGHEALGLGAGLLHPLTGADHILAMVAVGLWAGLRGGRAVWAWPAAFMAAMAMGFGLGSDQPFAWSAEPMVLASVVVLGALTAAQARLPLAWGAALIAACGAAHGYVHGIEAPGAGATYPLGVILATSGLHLAGLAAGLALTKFGRPEIVRLFGAGAAAGGLVLAVAA
jgi:urease accessory protein